MEMVYRDLPATIQRPAEMLTDLLRLLQSVNVIG